MRKKTRIGLMAALSVLAFSGCGSEDNSNPLASTPRTSPLTEQHLTVAAEQVVANQAAVAHSPYAEVLDGCTDSQHIAVDQLCSLRKLPLISMAGTTPNKQQILNQTLVSHQWMASRFSQLLDNMPQDMFKMFGAVTAVIIRHDIIVSHYLPSTGAIYPICAKSLVV